ncbi:MAG: hypothetical protein ABFD96_02970 [Armatimonadia bacterium]
MLVISLVALPLLANAQEVSSSPADATQDRFDFTEALQPGHEALSFSVRGGEQLNIPTGPRSELHGGSAAVRFSRCHTPHRERGLEMSVARLTGGPHTAKLWALVPVQRQYFHRQSRHTGYWELGVGISHLNTLVPNSPPTRTSLSTSRLGHSGRLAGPPPGAWRGAFSTFRTPAGSIRISGSMGSVSL